MLAASRPKSESEAQVAEETEGLGKLARDVDDFLFRLALHDPEKMAVLQQEAIAQWVPTFTILEEHAEQMLDVDLVRAFVEFQEAMTEFGTSKIKTFKDAVSLKLGVDGANVLLKKVIFAREYHGEVFEEGDEAFYWPPSEVGPPKALLVVLHGAFMTGRNFIWKWVFEAARRNIPIYAPSSLQESWSEGDLEAIEAMVAKLGENYHLPGDKTLVAGLSDGALATTLLCGRKRVPFQKAALLAGLRSFETNEMPKIPMYVIHGTEDPIFPIADVRETVEKLRAHVPEIVYRELAGVPHSFPYGEIAPLMDWFAEDRSR